MKPSTKAKAFDLTGMFLRNPHNSGILAGIYTAHFIIAYFGGSWILVISNFLLIVVLLMPLLPILPHVRYSHQYSVAKIFGSLFPMTYKLLTAAFNLQS